MKRTQQTRDGAQDPTAKFPVIQSILDPAALLDHIADKYALKGSATCRLLHRGRNDTYLVTTPRDSFIARVYAAWWRSAAEVAYELALLEHLKRKNVPIAPAVADRKGRFQCGLAAPEGERQLVLFNRVQGEPITWTTERAYRAGSLLARIHAASNDFEHDNCRPCMDLDYLIELPMAAVEPYLAHRLADWEYLQEAAARLHARARAAIRDGLEWGVCHGDFCGDNIHITANEQLAIFDFDFCGPGWRVYDFVDIRRKTQAEEQRPTWDSFVQGYSETRQIALVNFESVGLFVAISHLRGLGHHARNTAIDGLERMADWYLDWELNAVRHWEAVAAGG